MGVFPLSAADVFTARLAGRPAGVWSAPGRVNIIGEHTDYNNGLVLPFAIDARAQVALGPGTADTFRVVSVQRRGGPVTVPLQALSPDAPAAQGWAGYPLGVIWAINRLGYDVPPLDIALDSSVPAGAGLSSSAAVECAVALAISDYLDLSLDRPALARIAQYAENHFVGVPCGLMDQMASAASTAGHALLMDVADESITHIPFDTASAGLKTLVIDTKAHHSLADGEYAKRRRDCENAAAVLGVEHLSQVHPEELDRALTSLDGRGDADVLRRRVTHVVTENARVRATVALLEDEDIGGIGPLLSASHASLRDDYEVSCEELDLAAAEAESAGSLGARMVGGGFGGSVIALAPTERASAIENGVIRAFDAAGYRRPTVRQVSPADGARRDRL